MKLLASIILVLISTAALSATKEDDENMKFVQDLMLASKWTGMCGVYQQMSAFQESTKMTEGDEFIRRFVNTELARLDITQQQFIDYCKKASATYNKYYNLKSE